MLDLDLRLEALSATVGCAVKSLQEFRRKYPGAQDPPLLQPQDVVDIATGIKSTEEYVAEVTYLLKSKEDLDISRAIWRKIAIEAARRGRVWFGITETEVPAEREFPTEATDTTTAEVPTEAPVIITTETQTKAPVTTAATAPTEATVSTTAKPPTEVTITTIAQALTETTVTSTDEVQTEDTAIRGELFVNEEDFFDPFWDYDFTHIHDGAAEFQRGGEQYSRPCGWRRLALKVLGKYKDGNSWLGFGANAWPVSYHGTSIDGAKGIIQTHYKAGSGQLYGRGIYSTPDVNTALRYSHMFTSQKTKKTYEVILQNRINPANVTLWITGWCQFPQARPPMTRNVSLKIPFVPTGS